MVGIEPTTAKAETGGRTRDLILTMDALCQLSYLGGVALPGKFLTFASLTLKLTKFPAKAKPLALAHFATSATRLISHIFYHLAKKSPAKK